jgi:hypothetical protein
LELISVVLAFIIWGSEVKNKKILLRIDNQALVSIVNKRTSKSKRVMVLIRQLVFLNMYNNVQFKSVHIEGEHNEIADALLQNCTISVKTALSTEMSTLKSKIKTLEEQHRALTSQLKTEKGKLVLLQTQFESARKHEREIP